MNNLVIPSIDSEIIQERASEFAMKGVIESIKEFYTGYNSPFKKAIEEELKKKSIPSNFLALPDIMALINQELVREIDAIANQAVAKSFIPLVSEFLSGVEKEVNFSNILKKLIKQLELDNPYECSVQISKKDYGDLDVRVEWKEESYRLTLYQDRYSTKEGFIKYKFLNLPWSYETQRKTMKLQIGEATLEMPFTTSVLENPFLSYIARLIIAGSLITMDCEDFDEEWFQH